MDKEKQIDMIFSMYFFKALIEMKRNKHEDK